MSEHLCQHIGDIAQVKESLKVAHHRIDDLEKQNAVLMELVATVRVIAEQMSNISDKVAANSKTSEENRNEIQAVKEQPAQELMQYRIALVVSVITSIVGFVIGLVV